MAAKTLAELLRTRAASLLDKTCVKAADGRSSLSYRELDARASAFAAALRRRGSPRGGRVRTSPNGGRVKDGRPGDRVLLAFGNTPDFFAALFGCWRGGLVAVPVDPELAPGELRAIAAHADPVLVVTEHASREGLRQVFGGREVATPEDLRGPDPIASPDAVAPADPALLLYTSGTTGDPKGVLLSHAGLAAKVESITRWFELDESYTALCMLPTHFGHGLICNCLPVIGYGGTLVVTPPFSLDLLKELWPILDDNAVHTFSSVPTIVRLLIRDAERRGLGAPPSLRFVTCASAPLRVEEVEAFQSHFGVPLLNCYGLTETSGWSACSANRADRDPASVGKALDCEIRAFGPTGEPLPPGEVGELRIKGRGVMKGYYRDPATTREVIRDGWFSTGDVGKVDESGSVFLASRMKEIIIRAGKNVYPAEVDNVLMSHPEVAEAFSLGLSDPLLGEKVAACVVLREDSSLTEAELITHAQERLAAYKCPQRIRFVEKVPKTSRGKVNRRGLCSFFEV